MENLISCSGKINEKCSISRHIVAKLIIRTKGKIIQIGVWDKRDKMLHGERGLLPILLVPTCTPPQGCGASYLRGELGDEESLSCLALSPSLCLWDPPTYRGHPPPIQIIPLHLHHLCHILLSSFIHSFSKYSLKSALC